MAKPSARQVAWRACLAFALVTTAGTGAVLGSSAAGAAGNPALSKEILSHPGPGWAIKTQQSLRAAVSSMQSEEGAAVQAMGMTAVVAAKAWQAPHHKVLGVFLVAVVGKPLNATIARELSVAVKVATETLCEGATTDPPASLHSITSPPGYVSECREQHGRQLKGLAFRRANVLGIVTSTVPRSDLVKVGQQQWKSVPSNGFTSVPKTATSA